MTNVNKPATIKQLRQWVKELRSGKHKQRTDFLGTAKKGYCCLGVANRLFGFRFKSTNGMLRNEDIFNEDCTCTFLPEKIQRKLISLNDSYRFSFPEIADWIEEHLIKNKEHKV